MTILIANCLKRVKSSMNSQPKDMKRGNKYNRLAERGDK